MVQKAIIFKQGASLYSLNPDRVIYILCEAHKIKMALDDKEIEYNGTVNKLMEILPQEFVRVHKSYIANINRIELIEKNTIFFDNGRNIPIGRTYKQGVYNELLKNK